MLIIHKKHMKEITQDPSLVAYCGLYCGACKKYLIGKCPGCAKNEKASWCKIRKCNMEHDYKSCAECTQHGKATECKMFNNFIPKIFSLIFGSDRPACIARIKEVGINEYAREMTEKKSMAIKKEKI